MERLIGLYSPAPQSGKTFAATVLTHNGFQPLSFAEPLKHMAVEFMMGLGYTKDQALKLAWTDKEKVLPEIGKTVRYVLQTLGTEWGRNQIDNDVWITSFQLRAKRFSYVVVDDIRFENEAAVIKQMGGEMWMISRPSAMRDVNHASEGALNEWSGFDHFIDNNGSLKEFRDKIDGLI